MSNAIPMPHTDGEIAFALDIARHMAMSGIPIFVAPSAPGTAVGYHLPSKWEITRADPGAVDAWQPGMALCAVGGHSCDFLDIDPRNGGIDSAEALWRDGIYPCTYGQQITPSGGRHELIVPLRTGKGTPAPGIDIQGGRPDGTGRGFVFLAPTVRASKVDGIARPYRWTVPPDLAQLVRCQGEASGAKLAAMVPQHRGKTKPATDASAFFDEDMPHTVTQAHQTIARKLTTVTDHARRGWDGFRDTLNGSAFAIGAYVGQDAGIEYSHAVAHLLAAIRLAGHEPDGDDLRWIETGLDDGAKDPIRIVPDRTARPLATAGVTGEGFGARLMDAADLDSLEVPEALVEGWLYSNTTARLVGQAGAYKSFVAFDMALCMALGRDWHGVPVRQTPVLYVVGEGRSGYTKRRDAWLQHNGVTLDELRGKLMITLDAVQIGGHDWPGLTEWVRDQKCMLVVVDTVARATVGLDENSNKEQGIVVDQCRELCNQTGAAMLLVHHTGHSNGEAAERGRGASAWRAAVDAEWILAKTGDLTAALRNDRQKDAESGQTVAVTMVKVAGSLAVRIDHKPPESVKAKTGRAADDDNDERVYKTVKHLLVKGDVPNLTTVTAVAHMKRAHVCDSLARLSCNGGKLVKIGHPTGRGDAYQLNQDYSDSLGGLTPFVSGAPEGGAS